MDFTPDAVISQLPKTDAWPLHKLVTPYRPIFKELTGSVEAALLLQQLFYWWAKPWKGHAAYSPFYKFIYKPEPDEASDYRYQPGQSLQEELGFSRREIDRAMKISKRIKRGDSKAEALKVYPVTRWYKSGVTWFEVNEPYIDEQLNIIERIAQNVHSESPNRTFRIRDLYIQNPQNVQSIESETNQESVQESDHESIAAQFRSFERMKGLQEHLEAFTNYCQANEIMDGLPHLANAYDLTDNNQLIALKYAILELPQSKGVKKPLAYIRAITDKVIECFQDGGTLADHTDYGNLISLESIKQIVGFSTDELKAGKIADLSQVDTL